MIQKVPNIFSYIGITKIGFKMFENRRQVKNLEREDVIGFQKVTVEEGLEEGAVQQC